VLPKLPETGGGQNLASPIRPNKLYSGLEGSRGALYEIGVSDDGTLVGLTEDEMEESLINLRAMAASLGCGVEVTRMVAVGNCEWEHVDPGIGSDELKQGSRSQAQTAQQITLQAQLWVAEALVTPDLTSEREPHIATGMRQASTVVKSMLTNAMEKQSVEGVTNLTEQLRVTLSGPTTSGKSSLLGTLSTATLDNGRGKSRLSLLKHRHELVSGVTSSVAQELLGYKPSTSPEFITKVVNYASGNVTSWNDIHALAENGRLVFVSDSAGHPRYRRTIVRGLVGWAPHWTMLCIAADDGETSSKTGQDIMGSPPAMAIGLGKAHLELCLKLEQPLVIVITKIDLAKSSLRQTLSRILTAIKAAGRVPAMLPPDQTKNIFDGDLKTIAARDEAAVKKVISIMDPRDLKHVVPIIMTSAAKGTGIRLLHALLNTLPLPPNPTSRDYLSDTLNPEQPACLFHIEDLFGVPASYSMQTTDSSAQLESGTVVAGYLRFGNLSIGDRIVVGPFPGEGDDWTPPSRNSLRSSPLRHIIESSDLGGFASSSSSSHAHPSNSEIARLASWNATAVPPSSGEWQNAHIVSMRNLRLPTSRLQAGQVGTIGIVFDLPEEEVSNGPFERPPPRPPRMRKGMVLAVPSQHMLQTGHSLQAASIFTASFEDGDVNSVTRGSLVVVYIASIRASARVIRLEPHIYLQEAHSSEGNETEDMFDLNEELDKDEPDAPIFGSDGVTDVTLEMMTSREWIELGSQVLIMPGGGQGLSFGSGRGERGVAGLEGFVGKVVEVAD
jgi:GTPase